MPLIICVQLGVTAAVHITMYTVDVMRGSNDIVFMPKHYIIVYCIYCKTCVVHVPFILRIL